MKLLFLLAILVCFSLADVKVFYPFASSSNIASNLPSSVVTNNYSQNVLINGTVSASVLQVNNNIIMANGGSINASYAPVILLSNYNSVSDSARIIINKSGSNYGAIGTLGNGAMFIGESTSTGGGGVIPGITMLNGPGNVGIGTVTPSSLLEVRGASVPAIKVSNGTISYNIQVNTAASYQFEIATAGTSLFRMEPGTQSNTIYTNSTGVGIMKNSPTTA